MTRLFLFSLLLLIPTFAYAPAEDQPPPNQEALMKESIAAIIKVQEKGGQWPYQGVVKDKKTGESPIGYRVGGTSIVATTLLYAAPEDKAAQEAVGRATEFVLKHLEDPDMAASTKDAYDVRVWGHGYALEYFCHLRALKLMGTKDREIEGWIKKLVATLVTEEIPGGGWNYANRKNQASFTTAPIVQSLLLAKAQGEQVPQEIFERARKSLEKSRFASGSFAYSGNSKGEGNGINALPGSVARSAVCETTLMLLGGGNIAEVKKAIDAFHVHWGELEKRRQQPGTHVGDYKIAPYFFYYGHRYCAQAIQMLPEKDRAVERERLMKWVMKVRDKDGMWNDRVFERSRNYGTAMVVLIMLNDKAPMPPKL
ncbi:MAG TPA: hypothetical protein VE988_24200, partial [Gemmataceae bacterium]|nr:hypothetical protein [Gemmataceae bacterium]